MENFALFTMTSLIFFYRAYFLRYSYLSEVKIVGEKHIFFIFPWIVKISQQLQTDKVYHRKEQKISYLVVYLVNLSRKVQGSTQILLDYWSWSLFWIFINLWYKATGIYTGVYLSRVLLTY